MSIDIDEIIDAGRRWHDAQREAEEYELRLRADVCATEPDLVQSAFRILTNEDMPLSRRYPDGTRATPPYTPRQVHLLAQKPYARPITHEERLYQEAQERIREELGRNAPRRCRGRTKSGSDCRGWSLPYVEEPLCWSHTNQLARDHNAEQVAEEESQLKTELQRISEEMAMP